MAENLQGTEPASTNEAQSSDEGGIENAAQKMYLPRVTISYCTQCKWLLRAAYYAQELLSTFSTQLGEVSLVPVTGGKFTVSIIHAPATSEGGETTISSSSGPRDHETTVLWDRKTEGGFPETKQLKSLVRNVIDPSRDLGHVDRALAKNNAPGAKQSTTTAAATEPQKRDSERKEETCEDCQ